MHLTTILAFAFLLWQAEEPGQWVLVAPDDVLWTLVVALVQPVLIGLAAVLATRHASRLVNRYSDAPELAHQFHHRALTVLRSAICAGFAATVFLTRWPGWFEFAHITPALQIVGDLIVLTPFLAGVVALWIASYPLERAFRNEEIDGEAAALPPDGRSWRFVAYFDFHLRHHVLVVAVPMTLILFAADMTRGYGKTLQAWSGWYWTPDVLLGFVAAGVFIMAPTMLRRIWRTVPLEPGPVRQRLETLCDRIGFRFSEILVWQSDGMLINAAVMGVFAPVRYVLLSDALLSTMSVRQVEAVFGHEVGHVRYRHMQLFLVFAFVGWLFVAGLMESLARTAQASDSAAPISVLAIEIIGILATVVFWAVAFGWLSRRFERQADLHAARCVTPSAAECRIPCGVHSETQQGSGDDGRVCATGAAVFASALDRVAIMNGIPHEERSWRHSSIGSRIRFLRSLAEDPGRVRRFERALRRAKIVMVTLAIIGLAGSIGYWMAVPKPAILQMQVGGL